MEPDPDYVPSEGEWFWWIGGCKEWRRYRVGANKATYHENGQQSCRLTESDSGKMLPAEPPHGKTSKYKGVSRNSHRRKWQASISIDRKYKIIGVFDLEEDAAKAYEEAAKEYHGEYAFIAP